MTRKHWLDYTGFVTATVASISALIFTGNQLSLTRFFGKQQQRSYVSVLTKSQSDITKSKELPTMYFEAVNTGSTPAYEAGVNAWCGIGPYPLQFSRDLPTAEPNTPPNTQLIPPNSQGPAPFKASCQRSLLPTELERIAESKSERLYFYGTIHYKDIFDEEHYTQFCSAMSLSSTNTEDSVPCNIHHLAN